MKTNPFQVVVSATALILASNVQAQISGNWSVVAGGGGDGQGGTIAIRGTVGQPAAGRSSSGPFTLTSGFWAATLAGSFTPGNLLVEGVGDGSGLANYAQTTWIKEFTVQGGSVQTKTLPHAYPKPTASPFNILDEGADPTDGYLTRSVDGRLICVPGYNATNSEPFPTISSTSTVLRVVGLLNPAGVADTSRAVGMFSGANYHSVTAKDGSGFWAVGERTVGNPGGLVYFEPGAATNSLTNATFQCVRIFNNQLYVSVPYGGTPEAGIYAVGAGLPTGGSPALTRVISFGSRVSSTYEFEFNPAMNVAYLADDQTVRGGILRYTNNGSAWASNYTLAIPAIPGSGYTGARGLVVDWSGPNPVIYATTSEPNNRLVKIVDTGSSATPTTLATAQSGTAFRGLAWTPFHPAAPIIISEQMLNSGAFQLVFHGPMTQTYRVLATTNLALPSPNWTVMASGMFGAGLATFTDLAAVNRPARFYRLASP